MKIQTFLYTLVLSVSAWSAYRPTYEPLKWKGDGYIKLLFQVSSSMPGRFISHIII